MNNNVIYWIALQAVLGTASRKVFEIINKNINIEQLFCDNNERYSCGIFTEAEILKFGGALKKAQTVTERCEKLGFGIITPEDSLYPAGLRSIFAPPTVLYIQGIMPDFNREVPVAIVGTRNVTPYGRSVASDLAMNLASCGAVVVSGAAKGVDSYAHRGALQVFGRTAAVLGCSIDNRYLMENQPLRDMIAKKGVLISEYPPTTAASPWNFPERNRIISGISLGTVIVEAGEKSGSLITANCALEQGRELFAVPGNVMNPSFAGTNRLLREGAIPVFSAMDVLEEYAKQYPHKINLTKAEKTLRNSYVNPFTIMPGTDAVAKRTAGAGVEKKTVKSGAGDLSFEAGLVYNNFIRAGMTVDELVEACAMPVSKVMRLLTELEMAGLVSADSGSRYSLK